MSRVYHFHCDFSDRSVTVGVYLGRVRELELLVDGHEVGYQRVQGHGARVCTLDTVLPCDPPLPVTVEVTLPGPLRGEPVCALVVAGERLSMPERRVVRRARLAEASWYG